MNTDHLSDLEQLEKTVKWILDAPIEQLNDESTLAHMIGSAGLFYDNRDYPGKSGISLYGDDVAYMLRDTGCGMWQTPVQLAAYLSFIGQKELKTYLDIGTFNGWTITIVASYLSRLGIEHIDAFDIFDVLSLVPCAPKLWEKYNLPVYQTADISLLSTSYDLVFIDGDHAYDKVCADFEKYKNCKVVAFHDINDLFCTGVTRLWAEVKKEVAASATIHEFTSHPNDHQIMGIGVVEYNETLT